MAADLYVIEPLPPEEAARVSHAHGGVRPLTERLVTAGIWLAVAAAALEIVLHFANAVTFQTNHLDVNAGHTIFTWANSYAILACSIAAGLAGSTLLLCRGARLLRIDASHRVGTRIAGSARLDSVSASAAVLCRLGASHSSSTARRWLGLASSRHVIHTLFRRARGDGGARRLDPDRDRPRLPPRAALRAAQPHHARRLSRP